MKTVSHQSFTCAEDGQALVEFVLILPLLILLLLGVTYCGGLVTSLQNTAIAARHVARSVALDATLQGLKDPRGRGGKADETVGRRALAESLPVGAVSVAGINWGRAGTAGRGMAGALLKKGTVSLGPVAGQASCGIGVALYGATVKRDLTRDLTPLGRLVSRLVPGGGVGNLLLPTLSASAIMPAELPIRGRGGPVVGVLDLNPWISKVVTRSYKPRSFD
ncbi:MAG: TadE/TadG family type IV pilus assembly protein [Candidatus Sericytochromatia bacterium]|nr:TadE/TadG family type IV pilus assembly protein [Candidatus Sericytochromatia bacterium]